MLQLCYVRLPSFHFYVLEDAIKHFVIHVFYTFPFFFIPEETITEKPIYQAFKAEGLLIPTPGNIIDYGFIEKFIEEFGERFEIAEIAFDRWNATQTSINLAAKNFQLLSFPQTISNMSPGTKELMTLVLSKRIHHGGNKVLRWNASNVTVEQNSSGDIKPSKKKSTQKIDGIVALIMALDRAMRNIGTTSAYSERPMIFLD